ncbi:hypothetical protein HZC53_03190 [Candidatus Uhrbacteria bacterium]|nr:hypothetical protein [Candidatus Uhrbacteria bacterium]
MALFPSGQPVTPKNRDLCSALLLHCGADILRFLDGPWSSQEQFIRYIVRFDEIVSGQVPPFVVLTRTNPLGLVVTNVRRRLCQVFVNLKLALWVIYVDPDEDPFFFANAARLGTFDHLDGMDSRSEPVRVWSPIEQPADGAERYVILTPQTVSDDSLRKRVAELWGESQAIPAEPVSATRLRAELFPLDDVPTSRRRTSR